MILKNIIPNSNFNSIAWGNTELNNPTTAIIYIVLLVDAENSSVRQIKRIIKRIEASGKIIILIRLYADWTKPSVKNWKNEVKHMAVEAVTRFSYRKNSTDMTMAIDAMEILYTQPRVQGFCFVSSDGDFGVVAQKIKSRGLFVMGAGQRQQTSPEFPIICDEFIFTDDLPDLESTCEVFSITPELIDQAFERSMDAIGLAKLSTIGHHLKQLCPGFSIHKTGYTSLSGLIKSFAPKYELLPDTKCGLLVKRNA